MERKEKYCENCGAKLLEDETFCPECGTKSTYPQNDVIESEPICSEAVVTATKKKVKNKRLLWFALLVVFVVILIGLLYFFSGTSKKKATPKAKGSQSNIIEGHGEYGATFTFDFKDFTKKLRKTIKENGDFEVNQLADKNWKKDVSSVGEFYYFDWGDSHKISVYIEEKTEKVQLVSILSSSPDTNMKSVIVLENLLSAAICNMTTKEMNEYTHQMSESIQNNQWAIIDNVGIKFVSTDIGNGAGPYGFYIAPWSEKVIKQKITDRTDSFIFLKGPDLNEKYETGEIENNSNQPETQMDYSVYTGNWQDSDNDVFQNGGTLLEIKSIQEKNIDFSLTRVFSNGNALTFVDNINAIIENNEADFTYTDSRGNSGEGTLKFKDSSITAILTTTQKGEDSTYAADTNAILHKSDASSQQNSVNAESNEYIFPDSNVRYLTESEVMSLDPSLLAYARNEIFARHGRIFDDPEIRSYFESKSWYNGTISGAEFDSTVMNNLNDYEKANIEVIKNVEILQKDFEGQGNWNNSLNE